MAEAERFTPKLRVVVHHGASRATAEELRAKAEKADAEAAQAELFEQIGRLKMELEWVKKKAAVLS